MAEEGAKGLYKETHDQISRKLSALEELVAWTFLLDTARQTLKAHSRGTECGALGCHLGGWL